MISVTLLAASFNLAAQVYRCETGSGVTFSDMPCGDSAEQIEVQGVVVDTRGVGAPDYAEANPAPTDGQTLTAEAAPALAPAQITAAPSNLEGGVQDEQFLTDFLSMLKSQREVQIGEIDDQLVVLRERLESSPSESSADNMQNQIAALESNRTAILSEYDALIAEAEARLQ